MPNKSNMTNLQQTNLFKPIKLNDNVALSHRIVLAPLTRMRASKDATPTDVMLQYYDERSKTPGTLLIAEATYVSRNAGGYDFCPGLYTEEHVQAWRQITDKVHANGSFIGTQLWNLGRQANVKALTRDGIPYKSSTDGAYLDDRHRVKAEKLNNPLTALTKQEIKAYVKQYGKVAENAVRAGFDFIEIHGANGYIFDQFFSPTINHRTDEYGGSIENRSRFFFEVVDEIIAKLGNSTEKLAVRLSPWATYAGMPGTKAPISPVVTYGYIISELQQRADKYSQGRIGYLSLMEPRVSNSIFDEKIRQWSPGNNDFVYEIWKGVVIRSGNYLKTLPALVKDVEKNDRTLIAIGRQYIANPDLVERVKLGHELIPYDRSTFYKGNDWGYNSFPTFEEEQKLGKRARFSEKEGWARKPKALVEGPKL